MILLNQIQHGSVVRKLGSFPQIIKHCYWGQYGLHYYGQTNIDMEIGLLDKKSLLNYLNENLYIYEGTEDELRKREG